MQVWVELAQFGIKFGIMTLFLTIGLGHLIPKLINSYFSAKIVLEASKNKITERE